MKKITSNTEEVISFKYDGNTDLEIDSKGVVVSDEVGSVVAARLGSQVTVVDIDTPKSGDDKKTGDEGDNGPSHEDLKTRAGELGLKKNGTKDDLKARIAEEEARLKQEALDIEEGRKVIVTAEYLAEHPEATELKEGDVIDAPVIE